MSVRSLVAKSAGKCKSAVIAHVDPDDDSILRFVLRHYRFDAERHERRHVVVAAFDSEAEFLSEAEALGTELRLQKERGLADPKEWVSGVVLEPGAQERQQSERAARWRDAARLRSQAPQDRRD